MEYNESDFGSPNPQLSSEEITKSSPVLSTYSLPKYDFEDSLQGDIRFDSLVETETFLGIESQEDTSWIDDFSRGSSRIGFSSRDADTASIATRNNVWSEATSLESVEMLLKSVGQEDMILGETEGQDCGVVHELVSSTQCEEDIDHLCAKDVSSGVEIPVDELIRNIPDGNAVKTPIEDVQTVSSKLGVSRSNDDSQLQEMDTETIQFSETKDAQAMNEADDPSVEIEIEPNQIEVVASLHRELHEDFQSPVLLAESQVNFPRSTVEVTENLSSGLHQGNDPGNQLTGPRDLSESPSAASAERIDSKLTEETCKSETHTAESISGDLKHVVPSELNKISGGELGATGTGNNHLKEPKDSSNEECHDSHSMECLGKVDSLTPAENCKIESDKHCGGIACEESNVTLEESVLGRHIPEASNLNSGSCCDQKIPSDVLVTCTPSVGNSIELCATYEQSENLEETLAKDDEIVGGGVVEEGELRVGTEPMENPVALKKPKDSLADNEENIGIPSGKVDSKLSDDFSSLGTVHSSAVMANETHATGALSVQITPAISEEHNIKGINGSNSTIIERETMETTPSADMSDGNDKCLETIINVQSNTEVLSMDDKDCNTYGSLINDVRVVASFEGVCHTKTEGTPCESPSAICAADGREYEEAEAPPLAVNFGSVIIKDDSETENSIQFQLNKSGSACTNHGSLLHDGSLLRDPKASDTSDNDKTFSFIVTSSAEHSKQETVKLWQPFTSEVPASSQNEDHSLLTSGKEQTNLGIQGSHQPTNEPILTGSKSATVRKPRRSSGKTNKEGAKKEIRHKPLRPSNIFPTVESSQPDLNHASSLHAGQHFSDLQQLQLRAQIFVYGSLIQGTPPDEACMVAAFGGPDGGRSIWENARHRCLERIQSQKSQNNNSESPFQQQSSARTVGQKGKTSKSRNRRNVPTLDKASKSTPTQITMSHVTPPSSPLWTVHTPSDRVQFSGMPSGTFLEHNVHSQIYSHPSSSMTSAAVHTSSWSPHPITWVASPQCTTSNDTTPPTSRTKMEPVILTPNRESSKSGISVRCTTSGLKIHPAGYNIAILGEPSTIIDDRTLVLNSSQTPPVPKPTKSKQMDAGVALMVSMPQHKSELVCAAGIGGILPTTVATQNSESEVKNASSLVPLSGPSADQSAKGNINIDNTVMISKDMCSKLDEAKLHAEDASACSDATVNLSQEMWTQLAKQKDSGVASDVDAKVASAALAIAAAAAVAKAAAAAAKVASNAAIQAKLMAEEAMNSRRIVLIDSPPDISLNSFVSNIQNAMPSLISVGEKQNSAVSTLAAKLTACEKNESASAASKQAENMNAIVKAAELAAEAVTRAGKVAVMGNPLPLSELANAGPEGCWKLNFEREPHAKTDCHVVNSNISGAFTAKSVRETIDIQKETAGVPSLDIIPGEECEPRLVDPCNKVEKPLGIAEDKHIKEGSSVEISKEGAWYAADVLELKNGEAYVRYKEKPPTENFGELQEWIKLVSEVNEAPKIRSAHPMSAMPSEGTRKRRREALGESSWSVGDRVDAWMQNCWWEGIITEKSSKDDTVLTVHFSAQDKTSVIKAYHLRPSLIWQNGEWVEWSSSKSHDRDMRQEKRMKLCDPEHEVERNDKESENVDPIDSKIHGESRLLGLSDKEKTFDVGKSSKDGRRPVINGMAFTGSQNEGKRAIFGVPRPGKKRKFMDVSQHYVSHDSKTNETNDSTGRAKMLMPKGSGLPGWKSRTRIDLREKQAPAATQLRVPNSRKPIGAQARTMDKNNLPSTVGRKDNLKSQAMTGFTSFSNIGTSRNSPFEFSSSSNEKSLRKTITSSTSSKSDLSNRTKFEPPSQKLGKIEENKVYNSTAGTSNSEGVEPRRSNRRIQPTSRLLEGLQTSLSISKAPSVSHGKGLKSQNRSAPSRGNR